MCGRSLRELFQTSLSPVLVHYLTIEEGFVYNHMLRLVDQEVLFLAASDGMLYTSFPVNIVFTTACFEEHLRHPMQTGIKQQP